MRETKKIVKLNRFIDGFYFVKYSMMVIDVILSIFEIHETKKKKNSTW